MASAMANTAPARRRNGRSKFFGSGSEATAGRGVRRTCFIRKGTARMLYVESHLVRDHMMRTGLAACLLAGLLAASRAEAADAVTFNKDVAPILFTHCS